MIDGTSFYSNTEYMEYPDVINELGKIIHTMGQITWNRQSQAFSLSLLDRDTLKVKEKES